MTMEGWRVHAACWGTAHRWWDSDASPEDRARARCVCRTCPVSDPCLDYGRTHEGWGVWGGVRLQAGRQVQG